MAFLDLLQLRFAGGVVEKVFAKFADRQALQRVKRFLIEAIENQARNFVVVGINQRLSDNFAERHVGQPAFGGDSFALRAGRNSGQLVAGLLLVRFGEHFSQVGEYKSLGHKSAGRRWLGFLRRSCEK